MNPMPSSQGMSFDSAVARVADEFQERFDQGEEPDLADFARRYPEMADLLPQLLSVVRMMKESPPVKPPSPIHSTSLIHKTLGDYRIQREIGRGGMGIVYEAEQISLGRKVALKILPFASTLDPKHLQRFKNEAQAAAHLHHQNIVPIYGVGSESSVHYYAMQFIDGQTLASIIRNLSRPTDSCLPQSTLLQTAGHPIEPMDSADTSLVVGTQSLSEDSIPALPELSDRGSNSKSSFFRVVAELGIQAAEALQHAHERTVLHRDIKPANLLVDRQGKLWITDFGLARLEQNSGLTLTGDLLGTLRYMSPEQALGLNDRVDHRADIYGLGVTLYELLTLKPAFSGTSRQEILRQIESEEVRSPGRLNRAIPQDLETIVLKAMEKRPESRYASARDMADDLRRFLEDRPIRAKQPSLGQRLAKWRRRHKVMVRAGILVILVALTTITISGVMISKERKLKEDTEGKANTQALMARINEREAQKNAEETRRQQIRARQILNQVLVDLDELVPAAKDLAAHPEKRAEVEGHVTRVLHHLDFTLEHENQESAQPEAAKVHRRAAQLQLLLGNHDKAVESFRTSAGLLEIVLKNYHADPNYRQRLSESSPRTGTWVWSVPGSTKPVVTNQVRQPFTEVQLHQDAADIYLELGTELLDQGRPRDALKSLQQGLDHWQSVDQLSNEGPNSQDRKAETRVQMARAYEALGQVPEAAEAYRAALALWKRVSENPFFAARLLCNLEATQRKLDRLQETHPQTSTDIKD